MRVFSLTILAKIFSIIFFLSCDNIYADKDHENSSQALAAVEESIELQEKIFNQDKQSINIRNDVLIDNLLPSNNYDNILQTNNNELGKGVKQVQISKLSKKNQIDDEKILSELKFIIQIIANNKINSDQIKAAYEEVKRAAKQCPELIDGDWYKKSKNFVRGLESAELLGIKSLDFQNYSSSKAKITNIINTVRNFEDLCCEVLKKLNNNAVTKEEAMEVVKGLSHYFESLYLLKNLLDLKKSDINGIEYSRYIRDSQDSIKPTQVIDQKQAQILLKKIDMTISSMETISEQYNLVDDKDRVIISTPANLLKYSSMIDYGRKLIGGFINPENFKIVNEDNYAYKSKLRPGSVYWTFMDSEQLVDGSWDNLILPKMFGDNDKSIVKIFFDLYKLFDQYTIYLSEINKEHKKSLYDSENLKITKYVNLIKEIKNKKTFREVHENGKKAIVNLRKILSKRGRFNIGRSSPTEGLAYVGKWRKEGANSQIRVEQYEAMNALLDYISCIAIQIDSEMSVSSLINYTKVLSNGKEPWIFESENEQRSRMAGVADRRTFLALMISFIFNGALDVLSHVSLPFAVAMLGAQASIYAYNISESS